MVISMLKIRRPLGRLIFNMGIAIPGKTVFLIETAPWSCHNMVNFLQNTLNRHLDGLMLKKHHTLELRLIYIKPSTWLVWSYVSFAWSHHLDRLSSKNLRSIFSIAVLHRIWLCNRVCHTTTISGATMLGLSYVIMFLQLIWKLETFM